METTREKFQLTRVDAVKMIRRAPAGTRFALHVRVDVPIADEPDRVFVCGGAGHTRLTRAEAARLAGGLFSDTLEKRGARVPLSVSTMTGVAGTTVTYWLG